MKMERMRINKLVAGLLTVLMTGATFISAVLAAVQLGDFPSFLATVTDTGSELNALIVVGEEAETSDVVGAIDLATALATVNYQTVTTGGVTVTTPTVTGGVSISTAANPLYMNTPLKSVKTTLTSSVYYRQNNNSIARIRKPIDSIRTITTYENLVNEKSSNLFLLDFLMIFLSCPLLL